MLCCLLHYLFYLFVILAVSLVLCRLYMRFTSGKYTITANLNGKTFLITGATAGIGKETARVLARHGATVYLACRSVGKANVVAEVISRETGNPNIHILRCDLNSLRSVKECAKEFLATGLPLHCLINNAGTIANTTRKLTEDGIEETMQSNHFGHFVLTNLLLECLKASGSARIVNVSSLAHLFADTFDLDNINYDKPGSYDWKYVYNDSKLANVLFTRELAKRLEGTDVTTNCLHPGAINSSFIRGFSKPVNFIFQIFSRATKTSLEGAQTSLYLAVSPDVKHVTGAYFSDCKPAAMTLKALDNKLACDFWLLSEKLTGTAA